MENETRHYEKQETRPNVDQSTLRKSNSGLLWKILLPLMSLCILGYGFFFSKHVADSIPYLLGYYLPISLFIWLIFYLIILRKKARKIAGLCFLVIYLSFIFSGFLSTTRQKGEAKQAIAEIAKQYSKLIDSPSTPDGLPQRIQTKLQTSPKSKGMVGEMERFIKEYMVRAASLRNDYILELTRIGWQKILDPIRLQNDETFIESKVMIGRAKDIVKKYRSLTDRLLEDTYAGISRLDMDVNARENMKAGFEKSMVYAKSTIDRQWSLEEKCILELEKIINLLSARRDAWMIKNGRILFYYDNDLKKFNSYLASIQNIVKEQQAMQQESISRSQDQLRRMQDILK